MLDRLSLASICVVPYSYSKALGVATAFVVEHAGINLLITNFHVVSGRQPKTRRLLPDAPVQPDRLLIALLADGAKSLVWMPHIQLLLDGTTEGWIEHPTLGHSFDVVALPLAKPARARLFPYSRESGASLAIHMASQVAIIGFPHGISTGGLLPIWKSGTIASETDNDITGVDYFLVDSNTRKGMSGSPVIARRFGTALHESGGVGLGGVTDRVLGVYAGRMLDAPDVTIGRVWVWEKVQELIDHAVRLVLVGSKSPIISTVGSLNEWTDHMIRINVKLEAQVSGLDMNGTLQSRSVSLASLLVDFCLSDDRFGRTLDDVKLAAALYSSITASQEGDGMLLLKEEDYAKLLEIIKAPSKPYNPQVARQLISLLEYFTSGGESS